MKKTLPILVVCAVTALSVSMWPIGSAQDIATSDGAFAESGAFVVRKRQVRRQGTRNSAVRRSSSQIAETRRRVTDQARRVDRTNSKRGKTREVDPNSVDVGAVTKQKTPAEVSEIFAGVGEYYLREQNLEKALEFFREAVDLDSKNEKARLGLSESLTRQADALLDKDQFKLAGAVYLEAVTLNPRNAAAHAGLGEIAVAEGRSADAIVHYEKARESDSDLTEILGPLGALYFEAGEIAKSDEALTRAVNARPDDGEAQFYLGLVRHRQDRNEEALKAFKAAVELDPQSEQARYFLGEVLSRMERFAEAETAYRAAISLKADFVDALYDLGLVLIELEKLEEAAETLRRVVRLKADFGEAYLNLGDIYRRGNKIDEAIRAYRLATTFIKTDADLYSRYALVAAIKALEPGYTSYWTLAIDNLRKAVEIDPDPVDYSNLGWALYNSGVIDKKLEDLPSAKAKFTEAKTVLRKAIERDPSFAPAYLNLGMTLGDDEEFAEAAKALTKAIELRKDWIQAHNELGLVLVKSKKLKEALVQFKKAVSIDDKFAVGHYNVAETEIRLGRIKDAKKSYQKLKKLGRNDLALRLEAMTAGEISK